MESRSLEASAKYFVLGSFSSGILLYGISLLFGLTGSTRLSAIAVATSTNGLNDPAMILAMALLVVGFGFKIAIVPFHMWTPDVYEGSPTSVTAFMAVASKVASFAAFMRVFLEGLGGPQRHWEGLFLALCVATLVLGNVVAIVQTNIKRMLAYSSIAHAGYRSSAWWWPDIGRRVEGQTWSGERHVLLRDLRFYDAWEPLLSGHVAERRLEGDEIEDFTGLAKRYPLAALLMLVFLVSLAGIPPTAGFIGKLYLFMAAMKAGLTWLAVVAVI